MTPYAFTILGAAVAAAPQPAASAEQQVRAGIEAIASAANARDVEGVMRQMSPDVLLIYPGRPDARAPLVREGFTSLLGGRPTIWAVAVEDVEVYGDIAIARITWTLETPEGRARGAAPYRERDTEIWRRENGRWLLYRGMSFPIPAAKAAASG